MEALALLLVHLVINGVAVAEQEVIVALGVEGAMELRLGILQGGPVAMAAVAEEG